MTVADGSIPYSPDAEQACLGAALISRTAVSSVLAKLVQSDFYYRPHQLIYRAIQVLAERDEDVDILTVEELLKKHGHLDTVGGRAYLMTLVQSVPTAKHVDTYAATVLDRSVARQIIDACHSGLHNAQNGHTAAETLEELMRSVQCISMNDERRLSPIGDIAVEQFESFEKAAENAGTITGVPTGFRYLDYMSGGWQKGDLIILAARPSVGKTALAIAMAEVASSKHRVAIFSLEMSRAQIAQRMICARAEIDSRGLRTGKLKHEHPDEYEAFAYAIGTLGESNIDVLDRSNISVMEIRAELRRSPHEYGMVVIDYLQLMKQPPGANLNEKIGQISRELKALAREFNVPIICLSQLNRQVEQRQDKRPRMADLRESGSIESDADIVALIHRTGYYEKRDPDAPREVEVATIIIDKNRNGPCGDVFADYRGWCAKFSDPQSRVDTEPDTW